MPNPIGSWDAYFEAMRDKPAHPLYDILATHLPSEGRALEIGAGLGQGVRLLLDQGFDVTAVEVEPKAIQALREVTPEAHLVEMPIQDFALEPESYDVVVAQFVLFFLRPIEVEATWPRIVASIRPRGIFSGQLLGPEDDWVRAGYTGHCAEEAEQMFSPFEILYEEEVNRIGKTVLSDPKRWHVRHIIARKLPLSA